MFSYVRNLGVLALLIGGSAEAGTIGSDNPIHPNYQGAANTAGDLARAQQQYSLNEAEKHEENAKDAEKAREEALANGDLTTADTKEKERDKEEERARAQRAQADQAGKTASANDATENAVTSEGPKGEQAEANNPDAAKTAQNEPASPENNPRTPEQTSPEVLTQKEMGEQVKAAQPDKPEAQASDTSVSDADYEAKMQEYNEAVKNQIYPTDPLPEKPTRSQVTDSTLRAFRDKMNGNPEMVKAKGAMTPKEYASSNYAKEDVKRGYIPEGVDPELYYTAGLLEASKGTEAAVAYQTGTNFIKNVKAPGGPLFSGLFGR